jgi:hypothetical protein
MRTSAAALAARMARTVTATAPTTPNALRKAPISATLRTSRREFRTSRKRVSA